MYMLYLAMLFSLSIGIGLFAGTGKQREVLADTSGARMETAIEGRDRMLRAMRREIMLNPGAFAGVRNNREAVIPAAMVSRARASTGYQDGGALVYVLLPSGEVIARVSPGSGGASRFGAERPVLVRRVERGDPEARIGVLDLAALGLR